MTLPFLDYAAMASYLIPGGIILRYWKTLQYPMKIFALFCIYLIIDVAVEYILARMGIANHFLLNLYALIQVECILFLYSKWTQKMRVRDGLHIVGLMYFVFWFLDFSFLPFSKEFRESIDTVANVILIVSSLIILTQMTKLSEKPISEYSIFWIAIGTMLYSAGTIIIFSMSNTILKMEIDYIKILWHINWGFVIISNVLFAKSFLCKTF